MTHLFRAALEQSLETIQALAPFEEPLARAAALIVECLTGGGKLLVCGNGGSAADGADFSTEFACRFSGDRRPYPAINLAAGGSLITATGNDYGFDEVFARQVWAFGNRGDLLVAISTSGNSANIRRALEEARERGLHTIAMLGRDGGQCKGLAGIEFIVPCNTTARIQEAHKFLFHVLCEMAEPALARG